MMKETVQALQSVVNLPLQIDTVDAAAMEAALRIYNGKAMVNSVSGKQESMDKVFPLIRKYGGVVIGLTLDEAGIPGDEPSVFTDQHPACGLGEQHAGIREHLFH